MRKRYDQIKKQIADLAVEAKKNKLEFLVIKGIALDHYIYSDRERRQFNDLDILISAKDAISFHEMLMKMGFKQKLGPSSTDHSRYAKAFIAFNAKQQNFYTVADNIFPVKMHQWKPEYKPYCKNDLPCVEVHDGIYHISKEFIPEMLDGAVTVCSNSFLEYKTLNPEHTFIVLLVNTYQNSETFFSNTYDFSITIRDYEDIKEFLKAANETVDWQKVYMLLKRYELLDKAGIVLNNLSEIFGEVLASEQLPKVERKRSRWGVSINERMNDAALAKEVAMKKQRQEWQEEGKKRIYKIEQYKGHTDSNAFEPCDSASSVKYKISQGGDKLVFSWYIPRCHYDEGEEFLYQFRLFPLDENCDYISYKIDYALYEGMYHAYGRPSKNHNLGAIKKKSSVCFEASETKVEDMVAVDILVPFEVLDLAKPIFNTEICFTAEIYKKHWGKYYHSIVGNNRLLQVRMLRIER